MYFYTFRTINIFYAISEKKINMALILNFKNMEILIGEMVQKLAAKSVRPGFRLY